MKTDTLISFLILGVAGFFLNRYLANKFAAQAANLPGTIPVKTAVTGVTASTVNPAGGVASITPAGTISTPAFTGTAFDNRSAFIKVIFCKKT